MTQEERTINETRELLESFLINLKSNLIINEICLKAADQFNYKKNNVIDFSLSKNIFNILKSKPLKADFDLCMEHIFGKDLNDATKERLKSLIGKTIGFTDPVTNQKISMPEKSSEISSLIKSYHNILENKSANESEKNTILAVMNAFVIVLSNYRNDCFVYHNEISYLINEINDIILKIKKQRPITLENEKKFYDVIDKRVIFGDIKDSDLITDEEEFKKLKEKQEDDFGRFMKVFIEEYNEEIRKRNLYSTSFKSANKIFKNICRDIKKNGLSEKRYYDDYVDKNNMLTMSYVNDLLNAESENSFYHQDDVSYYHAVNAASVDYNTLISKKSTQEDIALYQDDYYDMAKQKKKNKKVS